MGGGKTPEPEPFKGPDEIPAGEKPHGPNVTGNSLQYSEHLSQHHQIQNIQQAFEHNGQGKTRNRKRISFACERICMEYTSNKSTVISGNKTLVESKNFHKNVSLNITKHERNSMDLLSMMNL